MFSFHNLKSATWHPLSSFLTLELLTGISSRNFQVRLSSAKVHSLSRFFFSFPLKTIPEGLSSFLYTHLQGSLLNFVCFLFNFLFLLLLAFVIEFAEIAHCVFLPHVAENLPCVLLVLDDTFKHFLFRLAVGLIAV